jgi:hypothetical protein
MYGKEAFVITNFSNIELKNYNGKTVKLDVVPETVLYVKNYSFVNQNQVIGELPSLKKQTVTATKKIISTISGELIIENLNYKTQRNNQSIEIKESGLIWILQGDVYTILPNTLLLKTKDETIKQNESLTNLNLINSFSGFSKNIETNNTDIQKDKESI